MDAPACAVTITALDLLSIEGLSSRRAAEVLGCSKSTVLRARAVEAKRAKATVSPEPRGFDVDAASQSIAQSQTLIAQSVAVAVASHDESSEDEEDKPVAGGIIPSPRPQPVDAHRRRFVVTCAQNNTHVHLGFVNSLRAYAAEHRSEILVSRFSYNKKAWANPQQITKDSDELWYDPEISDYVCDDSLELAPGLVYCGELDILPTATDPLSGLDSYTRSASAIVPHAKMAMKSMATMKHDAARFLYTTGTVTQRNYVERKAGQKASFHHVFGALAVEVDADGTWFVRQLIANDDGHFCDLDRLYTPAGSREVRAAAVTWGDFHEDKDDPVVHGTCFDGEGSIAAVLDAEEQHVHDLADFMPRNHHSLSDPYFRATMLASGTDLVEDGIARCASKLERIQREGCRTVVVESNHDQAFRRWLSDADGHRDPSNAKYWHFWNYRMFSAIEAREDLFVFEHAVRAKLHGPLAGLTFLREDDSWVICQEQGGVECGLHGHRGPNGSRGSPRSFRQLGVRANTAHTHSAGITEGIYTAGVSGRLDMGYNQGPSSWSHSHIVTYQTGKRAIVTQRGSRWRGAALPVPKPRYRVQAGRAAA